MRDVAVARARSLAEQRADVGRSLTARFWLRFHASLIVAGTFAAGFMTNALLLQWPVHGVMQRWTIAVLAGYAAFFVLVRLWLAYVGAKPLHDDGSWIQVDGNASSGSGGGYSGGGGSSGGGGASGVWEATPRELAIQQMHDTVSFVPATSRATGLDLGDVGDIGDVGGDGLPLVFGLIALADHRAVRARSIWCGSRPRC
jgi:hypothetical protein